LDEALRLLHHWVPLAQKSLGRTHGTTLFGLGVLAETQERRRQWARAATAYQQLLDASTREDRKVDLLAKIGHCLVLAGQPVQAEKHVWAAFALNEKNHANEWPAFALRSLLGSTLVKQGRYVAAEPLLLDGYKGMKKRQESMPRQARHHLSGALAGLVELYDAWGKKDQADAWRKTLQAAKDAP
jgi:hypothetical protein